MNDGSEGIVSRAVGAALLDVDTYEAVEADETATTQAAMVVLVVAVSSALGASGEGSTGITASILGAFLSWFIWAGVTNFVGTRLLGGTADWGELLRTLGFAQAPGVFSALAAVPLLGISVPLVVSVWTVVTGVVAIRQALDVGTGTAILTALLSMALVIAVAVGLAIFVGVGIGAAALLA